MAERRGDCRPATRHPGCAGRTGIDRKYQARAGLRPIRPKGMSGLLHSTSSVQSATRMPGVSPGIGPTLHWDFLPQNTRVAGRAERGREPRPERLAIANAATFFR